MPGLGGAWRSLVAHLLWEQGVGGSNPLAPTAKLAGSRREPCGCSSTVEPQPSKLVMGVRFPSPALAQHSSKSARRQASPDDLSAFQPVSFVGSCLSFGGAHSAVYKARIVCYGAWLRVGASLALWCLLTSCLQGGVLTSGGPPLPTPIGWRRQASTKGSVTGSLSARPSHPPRGVTTARRASAASSA